MSFPSQMFELCWRRGSAWVKIISGAQLLPIWFLVCKHSPKLSTLCSPWLANNAWLGPKNPFVVQLCDLHSQLDSVRANSTFNLVCLPLGAAVHGVPATHLSSLFKMSLCGTPAAVPSHSLVFQAHHLSRKTKVSHGHSWPQSASAQPRHDPWLFWETEFLSLSGILPVGIWHYTMDLLLAMCVCSLEFPSVASQVTPGKGLGNPCMGLGPLPWEWRDPQSCHCWLVSPLLQMPHRGHFPFNV